MATKRERVLAALRGDPVDRVPLSFWLHNFVAENSAKGLADETLRLARVFDWDFLKPQSRAQCFAEMWGLTYRPSTDRAIQYSVTQTPLAGAADAARLSPVDPRTGALGEQLDALMPQTAGIRTEYGERHESAPPLKPALASINASCMSPRAASSAAYH